MNRKLNWTPEIDKFIRDNYMYKTDIEIAEALGYKVSSVVMRRNQLGLDKRVQTEDFKELERYNLRLNKLKQSIKINDQVEIRGSGIRKVIEKYPNFVVCITSGFRESVLYTDIKRIVKNTV